MKMNLKVQKTGAFTLIELMVAVVIVALLAGMTVIGTRVAIKTAKASAIRTQIEQLSMALDKYKNEIGEYPPDFTDPDAVMLHVRKRWPRATYTDFTAFCADATAQTTWDVVNFNPASALVFWLGGLPDSTGKPAGFSLSPTDPLGMSGSTTQREEPRFAFADGTILTEGNIPAFCPNKDEKPIVYFLSTCKGDLAYELPDTNGDHYPKCYGFPSSLGIAVPYAKSVGVWYEADRFQLIHPGQDGIFNEIKDVTIVRIVNPKTNISAADDDNVTNFTSGATLDSEYETSK